MKYTEQEIEMLARFDVRRFGGDNWGAYSDDQKTIGRQFVLSSLDDSNQTLVIKAAARLMREAREQGLATARNEIRKAGEREQATWDQLVRDVKEARERGAKDMLDKALGVARKIAQLALGAVKKRDIAKPYTLTDAHVEGAYVQAETLVLALEELSPSEGPSEYERGAADMRERAASFVANGWSSSPNSAAIADEIRDIPLTVPQ